MRAMHNRTRAALSIALFAALGSAAVAWQGKPTLSVDQLFDRRDAMIATRDGTNLFTVILTPKGKPGPLPMLLRRTPYGASSGRAVPASSTPTKSSRRTATSSSSKTSAAASSPRAASS